MKEILALLFVAITMTSCEKEKQLSPYEYQLSLSTGEITADLNGKKWRSDVCIPMYYGGKKSDTINLTASVFVNRLERQNLLFKLLYLKPLNQKIESLIRYDSASGFSLIDTGSKPNSSFFAVNDDIVENGYFLYEDSNTNNHFSIEQYDLGAKVVSGRFESHYVRYWLDRDRPMTQGLPDTIHFTNGKFKFYLK